MKCIFDKFYEKLKGTPFYGELANKLQTFRKIIISTFQESNHFNVPGK